MPGVVQVPFTPQPGAVVASTAALVDITPAGNSYSIPAGSLSGGSTYRLTAYGRATVGTTATNITLGVYYGGTGGTLLASTGAVAMTVSTTNVPWRLEYIFTVRTLGTSGTVFGNGFANLPGSGVAAWGAAIPIPNTANAAVTVDTTTAKAISIGATLSQITGAPTITCDHLYLENLLAA